MSRLEQSSQSSPYMDIPDSSRAPDDCALAAVVSPEPVSSRDLMEILEKMEHRGGPLGAGFAVARWNTPLLLETFDRHKMSADLAKNYYVITTWSYNTDITPNIIAQKFQSCGVVPIIAEQIQTNHSALNAIGLSTRPQYLTRFIATVEDPQAFDTDKEERRRKEFSHLSVALAKIQKEDFPPREILIPSFTRVFDEKEKGFGGGIEIFKGVGTGREIFQFYSELQETSAQFQLGHLRFPTLSSFWWGGAHPFQQGEWIAIHNGNIISYDVHLAALKKGYYALSAGTDSEAVPAMMDYLTRVKGLPIDIALLALRAPQWTKREKLTQDERLFLDSLNITFDEMMPDGPAGLIMTNGREVYTFTGRHGVRPIHMTRRTKDGAILLASELGAISDGAVRVGIGKIDNDEHRIIYVDRGNIFRGPRVKTDSRRIEQVIHASAKSQIGKDLKDMYDFIDLRKNGDGKMPTETKIKMRPNTQTHQALIQFGISRGSITRLEEEARKGSVIIESMGEQKPLPIFRGKNVRFLNFFQLGASEVGDPSIDPDRMPIDTITHLGRKAESIDKRMKGRIKQVILNSPILFSTRYIPETWQLMRETLNEAAVSFGTALLDGDSISQTIPADLLGIVSCDIDGNVTESISNIYSNVEKQIRDGKSIIVLSDVVQDERSGRSVLPATLVVRLVDQYLKAKNMRHMCSLIVESLEIGSSAAVMKTMALGADAVSIDPRIILAAMGIGEYDSTFDPLFANQVTKDEAHNRAHNLFTSWTHQLKKLMGGADITDINNLKGNRSLIQSIGLGQELAMFLEVTDDGVGRRKLDFFVKTEVTPFDESSFDRPIPLPKHHSTDFAKAVWRYRDGGMPPETAMTDYFNLLEFKDGHDARIDAENVSLETKLFPFGGNERVIGVPLVFGAASLGAMHIDWHKIFAQIAERHNTFYNTGEGGWPLEKYEGLTEAMVPHLEDQTSLTTFIDMRQQIESGTKRLLGNEQHVTLQFASGRWGINMEVLRHAAVIEIKIAQGAKPGIGGHLPGVKVGDIVGVTRGVPPGSTVISPSTHQDITSIEDLQALISFLREASGGRTPIQVKLAALPGMEWIAVGTARCGADAIVIDGFRGATGAAPWAQQNEVGLPIATAIALVDDALRKEGIRDKVSLIGGGGIRTAKEMLMLIALGADAAMAVTPFYEAAGCNMCRGCHRGENCQPNLTNAMGASSPTMDIDLGIKRMDKYIERLKQDMKIELARLGLHSIRELKGRRDLLKIIDNEETIRFLDPNLSYIDGNDYSDLAAPLLTRRFVDREIERAQTVLASRLPRLSSGQANELDEFDVVETLERVVKAGSQPGTSSAQRNSLIQLLSGAIQVISQQDRHKQKLTDSLTDAVETIKEGVNSDPLRIQQSLTSIHTLNPLTEKLELNRICGCIGECAHRRPTSGMTSELVEEFNLRRSELIPDGERGQPLIIDRTDEPLSGDRYVGVSLISATDAFREYDPRAVNNLEVRVTGQAGHDFAALATLGTTFKLVKTGGQITGAGNGIGKMNQGGIISVDGNGGDVVGYAARGGRIMVSGSVDDLVGCNLRGTEGAEGPGIIIGGGIKKRAFEGMSGGFGIVIGHNLVKGQEIIGDNFASGIFGGAIYVREAMDEVVAHIHPEHQSNLNITEIRFSDDPLLRTELLRYGSEFGVSLEEIAESHWVRITSKTRNPLHEVYMEG